MKDLAGIIVDKESNDWQKNTLGAIPCPIIFSRVFRRYFLRLFFWFAAIFSFAVNSTGFACAAFPSGAEPGFASVLSGFRLFPAGVPLSLIMNISPGQVKYSLWIFAIYEYFREFPGK